MPSRINQCHLVFLGFSVVDADLGTVLGEGSVIKKLVMEWGHYKNQKNAARSFSSGRRVATDELRCIGKISATVR